MWAFGDRPFQRDVGDSWSYEHSYTLRERLLSDAHILPCTQRSALRDNDSFARVNCCGVLLGCMCRPRESWRRRRYFSGTRNFATACDTASWAVFSSWNSLNAPAFSIDNVPNVTYALSIVEWDDNDGFYKR